MDSSIPATISSRPCDQRLRAVVFLVVWVALLALGREKMLRDPGTLWHTVVGERMLETGAVVRADWLSYTEAGRPWIAQQWLAECVMALIHRAAGLDGLLLGAVTVIAWVFASLGVRLSRAGLPWPLVALGLMLVAGASSYHFMPRPHLATMAGVAWSFGLLCDVESGRVRPSRLLLLPLGFVVWVNLHGGVLGGIVTTVLGLAAWLVLPWPRSGRAREVSPILLGTVVCLSGATILVNPYGAQLPSLWLRLMDSDVLPRLIVEHAPLKLMSVEGVMIGIVAAVYIAVLWLSRGKRRVMWILPGWWLLMAWGRVRHGPLFAITAAIAVAEMLPFTGIPARLAHRFEGVDRPAHAASSGWRLAPVVAVIVAFVLQSTGVRAPIVGAGWARLSAANWPVEATAALRAALADRSGNGRVFNELGFGGYLIYRMPEAKVFIDDRCELYGDWGLTHYVDILRRPEQIEGLALCDDVRLALVRSGSRMDRYLGANPGWTRLHTDATAAAYARSK